MPVGELTKKPAMKLTRVFLYRVLEICYTDLGKTYQILLGKDGSKVFTDGSLPATTRIETPWEVWTSIARGEIRGDVALFKGMYKVTGDFSLMMNWDKYFSKTKEQQENEIDKSLTSKNKKPSMMTMLIPWITNANIGAIITLAVCACTPMVMARKELTVYDKISMAVVSLLSVLTLQNDIKIISIVAGYLAFGLMWLLSCFTRSTIITVKMR